MPRQTTQILNAIAGAAMLIAVAAHAEAQSQTPATGGLSLSAAIDRALASNPSIAAARLQRPIDQAGVGIAGGRPNPELAYELSKETPRQSLTATLPIELGGKRGHRLDVANAALAVGDAELARVINEVRNDVRHAYFEVVAADERARIADDLRSLAERARNAARARVTAGDVPQSDLTQAELVLANGENDVAAARGEAAAARADLNTLLGQPADAPLTVTDTLTAGALPSAADALTQATLVNGDLQVIDRRIAEQTAKVDLSKSLKVPDIAAGGAFVYDAEPEFRYGWRFNFGVTLPIFTTHKSTVLFEAGTLTRLQAERAIVLARISGGIGAALARATAARERMTRYQDTILPLSLEFERQAQAAYTGGQTGLPALVQALLLARDTRARGLDAGLDYQRALADLERAIGAPIR
jgi:cobalt-zinc-cadmium efflux system outer membrane protein